ncbi:uncharacterized protein LOC121053638 [Oryza brachyantha]|uniref:Uncharacterized protein n=1 Tax=Oryza brachyantha TaxID=4533 RepID=J3LAV4_ORYBR|nr:uncharacterized protein LOC121053638 [Oryza brachyantha]
MEAAATWRRRVRLQPILVVSLSLLLLSPLFLLPCGGTLAAGTGGGGDSSGEPVLAGAACTMMKRGGHVVVAPSIATLSRRILAQNPSPDGGHNPPFSPGRSSNGVRPAGN